jgi:hypothetical protein
MTLQHKLIIFIVSWYLCHTCMCVCVRARAFTHPRESQHRESISECYSAGVYKPGCHGTHGEAGGQLLGFGSHLPSCGFQSWWQAPLPTVLFRKPRDKICYWPGVYSLPTLVDKWTPETCLSLPHPSAGATHYHCAPPPAFTLVARDPNSGPHFTNWAIPSVSERKHF